MSRHVRGLALNRAQDFDGAVERLRAVVDDELQWELNEGISVLRSEMPDTARRSLHRARYIRAHAPSRLNLAGFRWYERARVISWVLTMWDELEDRPLPDPGKQAE